MNQSQFESIRRSAWQDFENQLKNQDQLPVDIAQRYRQLCHDLSIAKERGYSTSLIQNLHQLAWRGRQFLYRKRSRVFSDFFTFLALTLPMSIRKNWQAVVWAHVIFYLSAIIIGICCYVYPEFIYSIIPSSAVFTIEAMYDPSNNLREFRESTSDFMMFGYYIYNNIGIGLQVYTTGLLLGIGTILVTLFNGLYIGAIFGHMARLGYTTTFFPFVAGHGAFELTGICLAAAAGLTMGKALMFPGIYARKEALKMAGSQSFSLIIGVIIFLIIAAFIEAFWSASNAVPAIKYTVGAVLWMAMLGYLVYCRRMPHES